MKGEQEMGAKEKYVLYNMLYYDLAARNIARGRTNVGMAIKIHNAAMKQATHILAAIGESVTEAELFDVICQEVSVA